jgi:HAD superfamily hydrolase (TIGR01459 family)
MRDLSDRYPVWLCDVWGVIHDGVASFPQALSALTRHRQNSGIVILLTNAPRPREDVVRQLAGLGVSEAAYDLVITSGDVSREHVNRHAGGKIYHLGPSRDLGLLRGLAVDRGELDDAEAVVCTGLFDDTTETPDDYAGLLTRMRGRDLEMICANPDKRVRRGSTMVYCAGAIAERYEAMGGRVVMAGKPFLPMYELALSEAAQVLGRVPEKSRMLAIGDGPETDIAGAASFGIDAVLIAHGVSHGHAPEHLVRTVRAFVPNARIIRTLAELSWS